MGRKNVQPWSASVWRLARRQHGVVTRAQLVDLGLSGEAIAHRISRGRLHPLWRGVYAVGRPGVNRHGRWSAAVLACGEGALLSHRSAATLWGVLDRGAATEVTVPGRRNPRPAGIRVHRRAAIPASDRTSRDGIPVTAPAATLIDLAAQADPGLEAAVNAADRLDLIDPERLLAEVESRPGRPGVPRLRALLGAPTFSPTDSALERRFLAIVAAAAIPLPLTQVVLHGYRVDFYWPRFGLVVETDGLRYHRTARQQAKDIERDQAHLAAGLRTLRFTAAQVFREPNTVQATLLAVLALRGT
ncbi:MAG: DUF559 domain-containing protein [Solirubrobacterales bacterium]